MLNFRTFFIGLFASNSNTVDLEAAKEAGRRDAREMVGAYAEAFRDEVSHILEETREKVLYVEEIPLALPTEDQWSDWSLNQLKAEARSRSINVYRGITREELITLLNE